MNKSVLLALALNAMTLGGPAHAQSQVAPETHSVGDIPDSQAFVRYAGAAGHYSLTVPEGWARRVQGNQVSFTSKLGAVEVSSGKAAASPTVENVKGSLLPALAKTIPGLKVTSVQAVRLPAGPAVLVRFTSAGTPNPVIGKSLPMENDLYILGRNGQQLLVRFTAPLGADNVDAWKQMAQSIQWR
ncbi:hypothetical protein [Deinococcus sp. DB0503]|uniref:hypothetical protein n=1 Tax=Deinococcus sp. DB0503 TaxID=2479203 RepID=UPI0018DFE23F|nr:hypothetical protein [Deinococcus sp. DB0503]MBI0447283.1 hypothetical protein [Deinococcus sp. DB0503]